MAFDFDAITAALSDLIATPEVDYKVGDKEFKNGQKTDQLLKMAELEYKYPLGDIHTVTIDNSDIDEFGIDHTQLGVPTN